MSARPTLHSWNGTEWVPQSVDVAEAARDHNVYQHPRLRRFTDWLWRGVTYVAATPKRIWGAVRYGGSVLI